MAPSQAHRDPSRAQLWTAAGSACPLFTPQKLQSLLSLPPPSSHLVVAPSRLSIITNSFVTCSLLLFVSRASLSLLQGSRPRSLAKIALVFICYGPYPFHRRPRSIQPFESNTLQLPRSAFDNQYPITTFILSLQAAFWPLHSFQSNAVESKSTIAHPEQRKTSHWNT